MGFSLHLIENWSIREIQKLNEHHVFNTQPAMVKGVFFDGKK
jgi:hypothetical protein